MARSLISKSRVEEAEKRVATFFRDAGWLVIDDLPSFSREPVGLLIQQGLVRYSVAITTLSESRPDRVIPLLAQTILIATANTRNNIGSHPLAIVYVASATPSLARAICAFGEKYVPDVAIGIISGNGLSRFRGNGFEELSAEPLETWQKRRGSTSAPINLFSDLNQWMLKILLAPDIAIGQLQAPRQKYRTGAELAAAAKTSQMSASRFLQQLRNEGFLDESSRSINLVRRRTLFQRWQAATVRPSQELSMKFRFPGKRDEQIKALFAKLKSEACLGFFAAADALNLGHVIGVPPYIYVPALSRSEDSDWRALRVASSMEPPDVILRQASTPKSIFRGAVDQEGVHVADVLQVWLDVANHPSRGLEQATLIYDKVILPLERKGN